MTELELYKFVIKNNIEYKKHEEEILLFIPFDCLKEFCELLGHTFIIDGYDVVLKQDYIVVNIVEIGGYFGLDLDTILF